MQTKTNKKVDESIEDIMKRIKQYEKVKLLTRSSIIKSKGRPSKSV